MFRTGAWALLAAAMWQSALLPTRKIKPPILLGMYFLVATALTLSVVFLMFCTAAPIYLLTGRNLLHDIQSCHDAEHGDGFYCYNKACKEERRRRGWEVLPPAGWRRR